MYPTIPETDAEAMRLLVESHVDRFRAEERPTPDFAAKCAEASLELAKAIKGLAPKLSEPDKAVAQQCLNDLNSVFKDAKRIVTLRLLN